VQVSKRKRYNRSKHTIGGLPVTLDPHLSALIDTLQADDHYGIVLLAQLGGTPQEIQLILQSTINESTGEQEQLRVTGQYILRAIGVREHRIELGLFKTLAYSAAHPILDPYNTPLGQLYFRGQLDPARLDALLIDFNQLYLQTYSAYDPFRRMADEVNRTLALGRLLSSGGGLLATCPQPFAEKLGRLLDRYGLETRFIRTEDDQRPPIPQFLLALDEAYLIASLFSLEEMKGKKA
jgi:hypothetical protein